MSRLRLLAFVLLVGGFPSLAQSQGAAGPDSVHHPLSVEMLPHQDFGGFGFSAFGFAPRTRHFSFYYSFGREWNPSSSLKFGVAANVLRVSWFRRESPGSTVDPDVFRYFSVSNDLQAFTRVVLRRMYERGPYRTHLEIGSGYNAPIYFKANEASAPAQVSRWYPNRYYDFYGYLGLYGGNFLGLKLEYHPFDVIRPPAFADLPRLRLHLEFVLHDGDYPSNRRSPVLH